MITLFYRWLRRQIGDKCRLSRMEDPLQANMHQIYVAIISLYSQNLPLGIDLNQNKEFVNWYDYFTTNHNNLNSPYAASNILLIQFLHSIVYSTCGKSHIG